MATHNIILIITLLVMILLSAFFSASETSMMAINRYRLKHLAKTNKNAARVQKLLERPDRLLGVILLGNTFIAICASSIATIIAVEWVGENLGLIVASVLTTLLLLIFGEVSPKTLAALYPESVAFKTSLILKVLLKILYPLVWLVNTMSNGLLKLGGVSFEPAKNQGMSRDELRTVVHETAGRISSKHRNMLLGILDLEKVTVDDIMIPRNDVVGIDIDNEWDAVLGQLSNTQHTFLPVYSQDLNNIIGVIHAKKALHLLSDKDFNETKLRTSLDEAVFIPQGTTLTKQLINFQKSKQRFALIVDEYGDILGILTLEDILEEIVGDFTTDLSFAYTAIVKQSDGSYVVDGGTTIRDFNRASKWHLPLNGPKTINGLITDYLQTIPEVGTCCLIEQIPIEVMQVQDNRIKTVKILPPISPKSE